MSGTTTWADRASVPYNNGNAFTPKERGSLLDLQGRAISYFLENQAPSGLFRDRQSNRGRRRISGLCSTSATGMGLIALALATDAPHRMLSREDACRRIGHALEGAERLGHGRGILPHFVDARSGRPRGHDALSTIDTAWLLVGALWSARFLGNSYLIDMASRLYDRVDWRYWTVPDDPASLGLLRHGRGHDGRMLGGCWDRLNGETIFLYVLAAGADDRRSLSASCWSALRLFYGSVGGHCFNNADLGLFVFQYGLDLLDLRRWRMPGSVDLFAEARVATAANRQACQNAASMFQTYRHYWGLSAGDGPAERPAREAYRAYSPAGPIDGTAHLMAALASVAYQPQAVLENLDAARGERVHQTMGRYGLSNINLDRFWVGPDMVGIDAGAAILALDNVLAGDRVRSVFHELPYVRLGLARLGFADTATERLAS
jgi:hypothetical protein